MPLFTGDWEMQFFGWVDITQYNADTFSQFNYIGHKTNLLRVFSQPKQLEKLGVERWKGFPQTIEPISQRTRSRIQTSNLSVTIQSFSDKVNSNEVSPGNAANQHE